MRKIKTRIKDYPHLSSRSGIWREIAHYIENDILQKNQQLDCCVEIGSGYCDFINQFSAQNKICYEQNPKMKAFANPDIDFRCQDAIRLTNLAPDSIDLIFASNFLEHLTKSEHDILIPKVYDSLKRNGKFILIQPNYRLCPNTYFDDETHQTIFDDKTIQVFLKKYGFKIHKIIPNFLPFSMKSKLPKWPILVRMYLHSPIRPNAAQMYVVAQKR